MQIRKRYDSASAISSNDNKFEEEDTHKHSKSLTFIQAFLPLTIILYYAIAIAFVYHRHTWLPPPQPQDAPSNLFSENRARIVLNEIMSFGYRPLGSQANDVHTVQYLLNQIQSHRSSAPETTEFEVDVQRATGAFLLDFLSQFQNVYANVTNIVVRIGQKSMIQDAKPSVLISAHFDAAIGGAAASDDGVNVAIMMELVRFYSLYPPSQGYIVFNFNGAEETLLQAAHAFITQHPYAHSVQAFINLEAIGAGGREILFQTGNDALARAYARGAKYPHCSIIAQEIFRTGLIKSDTDFRIYRDYGQVPGMDFAYITNGYVYHTSHDVADKIHPGSIQRLGDNLIGILHELLYIPNVLESVAADTDPSNIAFFDVLGYLTITIYRISLFTFDAVLSIFVFAFLYRKISINPIIDIHRTLFQSLFATLGICILMTLFAPLSWFTHPILAILIYGAPALAILLQRLIRIQCRTIHRKQALHWTNYRKEFDAVLASWLMYLIFAQVIRILSSYLVTIWVLCPFLGRVVVKMMERARWRVSNGLFVGITLLSALIPLLLSMQFLGTCFAFFVPLFGRAGTLPIGELVLGLMAWYMLVLSTSYGLELFLLIPTRMLYMLRNGVIVMTVVSVLIATTLNPFSTECPQRLLMQHVTRQEMYENETMRVLDSGLWINALDARGLSLVKPFFTEMMGGKTQKLLLPPPILDMLPDIYDSAPFIQPVRHLYRIRFSWYLPSDTIYSVVPVHEKSILQVISKSYDPATNRRRINLQLSGPAQQLMFIDATKTKITRW